MSFPFPSIPFPLRYWVGHRSRMSSGTDALGNTTSQWAEPEPRRVYGWGAPHGTEPKTVGHDRDVVEIELLVPPDYISQPGDRVVLDFDVASYDPDTAVEYDVIGAAEMYTANPFGFDPGGVVNLRRVNG